MLNLSSINIGTMQFDVMAKFYREVIGKEPEMSEGKVMGWLVGSTFLSVMEHSEAEGKTKEGPRVMFNFDSDDVKGEFERVSKVEGITVVKEPYGMTSKGEIVEEGDDIYWISTLADPDGNYFQIVSPWKPE
jgi:predicted enzyme related to lactoylglutathione lyase